MMLTHNGFFKQIDRLAVGSAPCLYDKLSLKSQFDSYTKGDLVGGIVKGVSDEMQI